VEKFTIGGVSVRDNKGRNSGRHVQETYIALFLLRYIVKRFTEILEPGKYREILEKYYGKDKLPEEYTPLIAALEQGIVLDMDQIPTVE
jgi:hypothetical protein